MTELEMFKKLFTECSIWRGGTAGFVDDSRFPVLPVHFAVKLKNGKTDYIDVNLVFDANGRWIDTVKGG